MKAVLISYIFVVSIILAVLADRLPLIKSIGKISALGKISLKIIHSKEIDDTEKQKLLLANSAVIFTQSLKIAALVILVLAVGYLLVLAGDFTRILKRPVLLKYMESVPGISISIIAFLAYFLIKKIYDRTRL
ncbi:MAG TPA: hypothetical protein VFE53_17370 [Mucilaginibacter sp.]|jgi:hypothetical protein|nr:hypothetical protein [Mucilaginibacter sp.]